MRKSTLILLTLAVAAACSSDAPTTPAAPIAAAPAATANRGTGNGEFPGWRRTPDAVAGTFVPLNCAPRHSAQGSATIGPSGGVLQIGTHRLIVPAGALTQKVLISGTVPEGKPFQIDLQP